MTALRIASLVTATRAEGPGWRAALWVQGCSIRCAGCFNPHTWSAAAPSASTGDVLLALTADPRIEGVTLLGGEPFDQPGALADLAESLQERGLGVITFTGHLLEDLRRQADAGSARLLAATDLLIDGPFDRRVPDTSRPLVGSRNQRFINLTPRYVDWVNNLHVQPDRLEVRIRREGTIQVTGWADDTQRRALTTGLDAKRSRPPRRAEAIISDRT